MALGVVAGTGLAVTIAFGRAEPLAGVVALLGAAYAVILVVDDPTLDARAAVVGAVLLAIAELAQMSVAARTAVTDETEVLARRLGSVALEALAGLLLGGALIAVADLVRTSGFAFEVVGAAAALGAVGVLVIAARSAHRQP